MTTDAESGAFARSLESVWQAAGCDPAELAKVRLHGNDPHLPSIFRVGEAAVASIAAVGAAAAECSRLRSGTRQGVRVDVRGALAAFRSERYLLVNGEPPPSPWGPLSGYFRTANDRWVQLHANFPHHHKGLVELLECKEDRQAVRDALRGLDGEAFEQAANERGLCVGLLRTHDEWQAHEQGRAVASLPLLEVTKVGDSPPEPFGPGDRPLSGIRALDLTRVIAGPVCGRTLAGHGAEVLRIGAPQLPFIPHVWLDLARGKRSAHLDLCRAEDVRTLQELVRGCDVFSQSYRPGSLGARGFGPADIHSLRPGAVYVTLSAYGHTGPWSDRRGFDSLVQTVSGIGHAGADAAAIEGTKPLPCQALDHATGYLAAFGAMVALRRRAEEGGSYLVRVSLAQTGHWLWGLGRVDVLDHPDTSIDDVRDLLETRTTAAGEVTAVRPAETLSQTPAHWRRAPVPLGADPPRWQRS